jgi:membrane protease YdiL (CAAX protease family)
MALTSWFRSTMRPEVRATPIDRLADPPARTSPAGAAIVLVTVALFSLFVLAADGILNLPAATIAAFGGLVLLAVWSRSPAALHVTIFALLAVLAYRTPEFGSHPFPLLNALLGYAVVVMCTRRLRESLGWLHTGSLEPGVLRLIFGTAAASLIALPIWFALTDRELTGITAIAEVPVWALAPTGVFFALVNAGVEEAAFRGVLLDSIHSAVGSTGALFIQAAAFGIAHYAHGVPDGPWGAALSGGYGLMLGVIRLRSRGMLAPWIAHAITDAAIFVMIALST